MIVPTIATIVVGSAGLVDQVDQASNAERARTLTVLAGDAGTLVHQLQDERALAVQLLIDQSEADVAALKVEYTQQQQQTKTAGDAYRQDRIVLANIPDSLRELLNRIETQLDELAQMRADVEGRTKVPLSIAERRYRVLIGDLLDIRDAAAQLTGDPTLTDRMRAAAAVATAKEFLSQERAVILKAIAAGVMSEQVRREYLATLKSQELALVAFHEVATPDQREMFDRTVAGAQMRTSFQLEGRIDGLAAGGSPADVVTSRDWDQAMIGRADQMNQVEVALNQQALDAATLLGDLVQRRVLVETGLLLLTLVLGVLFAWLVARSMARSLRDLRQGALAVANYGLQQAVAKLRDPALSPHQSAASIAKLIAEPLPVRSKDEFGQVTEAFNAVHLEAVRTAAEQAALRASVSTMFVNLARRSQLLVDRLIGQLDQLERGEQDPDRLAELFKLDHLATRMRRNDENLLVLAGADSTRVQRDPAALMDVLRAAQSEVEHYTRVQFNVVDHDIEIAAHAVNDLVHLVAELFDNATTFSPPQTPVTVEARRVGDRVVLQVTDRGIGMSADQYAELNERLATPPLVDVAVSRMMGLVVVARLAARHAVPVELRPAQARGTIADVVLPSGVLVPRALAGRTQLAPTRPGPAVGGPGAGPADRPSPFGPPLALESGSFPAAAAAWPAPAEESWAGASPRGSRGPSSSLGSPGPLGAPPPPQVPLMFGTVPPVPGAPPSQGGPHGGPPTPTGGLGAARAGDYPGYGTEPGGSGSNGYPGAYGGTGRALPAWYDLTGTGSGGAPRTGADMGPPGVSAPEASTSAAVGSPGGTQPGGRTAPEPLPQRRPRQWGDPEPDAGAEPRRPEVGHGPTGATPVVPGPVAGSGPTASVGPGGAPSAEAAVRPPVWPPLREPVTPEPAGESVLDIPERLSASLDMTSELPRTRESTSSADWVDYPAGLAAGASSGAPHDANDLTMELPIFHELESAWFHSEPAPAPVPERFEPSRPDRIRAEYPSAEYAHPEQVPSYLDRMDTQRQERGREEPVPVAPADTVSGYLGSAYPGLSYREPGYPAPAPEPGGRQDTGPGVSSRPAWPVSAGTGRLDQPTVSGDARGPAGEVSWRSAADGGWIAARAATDPRDGGSTEKGLPRRIPMAQLVPGGVETVSQGVDRRSPDAVRGLLSAYHRGVQRGRGAHGKEAAPVSPDPENSGREQEA